MDNILFIDDEQPNLDAFEVIFGQEYNVFLAVSTTEAYNILCKHEIKVVITDQKMPKETGIEFISRTEKEFPLVVFMILTAFAEFEIAEKAILTGNVYRFLLKPWNERDLKTDIKNAIEKYNYSKLNKELMINLQKQNKELTFLKQKLEDENAYLKEEIKLTKNFDNIVANDEVFLEVLKKIEQVADADASVLVIGETGTGKELIARAIHNLSNRREAPFISVNCAAIPESLFESELFGHEKGAFTGAVSQRKGKFELANNGTLFLDEIGEIPMPLQAKLLRAIQEGEIERLGSIQKIKLDIRLVSATNKNLFNEVEKNNFRSDLYYRLNVFPINIPPLRKRKNDIPMLAIHFVEKYRTKYKKRVNKISKSDMSKLKLYNWPGNVREMENIIERAVIISDDEKLNLNNLIPNSENNRNDETTLLAEVEKKHILKILERTSWRVSGEHGAAKLLGMKRSTLMGRMKKLNISKNDIE